MTDSKLPQSPTEPEYRRDPITGQWVLLASERARRPVPENPDQHPEIKTEDCPFCEGNEDQTPPEEFALRESGESDGKGWSIRVVPNRYPAVRMKSHPMDAERRKSRMGRTCEGIGKHEVVIETPDHHWTITYKSSKHFANLLGVYKQRLRFLRTKRPLRYAMVFKNVGKLGGASQDHAHSQILATSTIPPRIQEELNGSENYYQAHGHCVFCQLIEWELEEKARIVEETEDFVAWCPYAGRFPFEVWVAPKSHECRFESSTPDKLGGLGELLRSLLFRLEQMTESIAYNYYIHTAPFAAGCDAYYHWHLEIVPRLIGLAGFELGGGMHINPVPPEWAAVRWQEAKRPQ